MEQSGFLRTIQIIAMALISGVLLFMMAAIAINTQEFSFSFTSDTDSMLFIVIAFTLISSVMSQQIFKMMLKNVATAKFSDKKTTFQTAVIVSMGVLEGSALFSIAMMISTPNLAYLCFAGVSVCMMVLSFPTRAKFIDTCSLTREEINQL